MVTDKELPALQKRWASISKILKKLFPNPKIALTYSNPWELLVAVQLSAQCTDKKINEITPALFKKYKKLDDYVKAKPKEFEKMVYQSGFYRAKTKNILAAAKYVKEKHKGVLPKTMAEMVKVPGMGRKSANVVLGNAYGVIDGIAVDTHVKRFAERLALSKEKDPVKIEKDLMRIVPKKDWFKATYMLIDYGRAFCPAKPHNHEDCPLVKAGLDHFTYPQRAKKFMLY